MPLGQGVARTPHDTAAAPDFGALMAPSAPFEPQPQLAVAVSGGSDSTALTLLAHEWARARGGRITALTVDHGLRAEAAAEAAQVGAWCAARGIEHVVLARRGAAPASGIQAFARAARYALLENWCRDHFVLHLLLAHQREDQAETVALRAARGSGVDGLAGMASIVERNAIRLLRPLLGVSRATLRAYLLACGQPWIEDPSNRNPRFTRVRIRAALGDAPLRPGRGFASARAVREDAAARHLARFVALDPAGFATIDPQAFAAPQALGRKTFGAILATISGREFPPRSERIERLYGALTEGLAQDRTLGGCLILRRRGKILVCREPAAIAAPRSIAPGATLRWDGRFRIGLGAAAADGLTLGALGADAPKIAREQRKSAALPLPAAVRASLPTLRDSKGVVAVPVLGYFKGCRDEAEAAACRVEFWPVRSLTGAGFTIV
jgi:tRNA(Ile)-lysidine synthase